MHSNLVGDLNAVLELSLYFGLTNSSIAPPVFESCFSYGSNFTINWLMFPGYGEKPVAGSLTSPDPSLELALNSGSN